MSRRNHAFTLIELLVVIGIILVLVGMAVIGFRTLDQSVASRSTRVTLKNLQSMQAELEAEAGPDLVEGPSSPPAIYQTQTPPNTDAIATPSDVNPGQAARYSAPFIDANNPSTQKVMGQLMRSPKNNSAVRALPAKQLFNQNTANNPPTPIDPPLVLDAWQNPILFVPSGGLQHVVLNNQSGQGGKQFTIRSSGVYDESQTLPALGPKDRPFWASAGQDGDFSKGDDNIYSFQD